MKIPFFDLTRQYQSLKQELDPLIAEVMHGGWYAGGPYVTDFENQFARYIGVNHCIGCGNCTDALEIILRGYNIGVGDEVIVPAFTWISDAEVVTLVGAKIIFADVHAEDLTIDPERIQEAITTKTKAIIVTHLYGRPCRMDEIIQIAERTNIKVIEDCAQSAGASYKGRKTGSLGHVAAFSFYPTKNLNAFGDGGAITTNDDELARKVRLLANHGQQERDVHLIEGRNSRLDTLQAAVLSLKLKYLDEWNAGRRDIARKYTVGLGHIDHITCPVENDGHIFHLYVVRTKQRTRIREQLLQAGIDTAIHYPRALPEMEVYRYLQQNVLDFPQSTSAAREVLSLPGFPEMTKGETKYLISVAQALVHRF